MSIKKMLPQFGLFFAIQKYKVRIKSNDELERHRENKNFDFTYRPSPQENLF